MSRSAWEKLYGEPIKHFDEEFDLPFYSRSEPDGPECWCGRPSVDVGPCSKHTEPRWPNLNKFLAVFVPILGLVIIVLLLVTVCGCNPDTLQSCGNHCSVFPASAIAEDIQPHLTETSPGLLCTPNRNISQGGYSPLACPSLFGAEGRCLGACVPEVASYAALLPYGAPCWDGEVCVPCTNPFTKSSTGVCEIGSNN